MYLWSNPDLPAWKRLFFGWFYLPILFWWWLSGKPIYLGKTFNSVWLSSYDDSPRAERQEVGFEPDGAKYFEKN